MVWSYSGSRTFHRCQRQWFIKHYVANANAKKQPIRREAYLLSTLQSPYAWRGSLVDTVISKYFVQRLIWGTGMPSELDLIREARKLFQKQVAFASANRMRESGMTKAKAGDSFAALYPVEYEGMVSEEILNQMWIDIEQSITNFRGSSELMNLIQQGEHWAAQRPLTFTCEDIRTRMVPDLIVFYKGQPPLIIDWKVHQGGEHNARRQLASYALALVGCEPHRDFPESLKHVCITNVQLLEVQLLTQQQRFYTLTDADVETAVSYIAHSQTEMDLATEENPKAFTVYDFPTAGDPRTCQHCNFRSICWNQETSA